MKKLVANIIKILCSSYTTVQQFSVTITYIKIRLFRFFQPNSKHLKIVGFDFSFNNINELHDLFEDVFINCVYNFRVSKKRPIIIDAGANIGDTALFFKYLYPQAHIIAFEPLESNYNLLTKNIASNYLKGITAIKEGLGKQQSRAVIYGAQHVATTNKHLIKEHQNTKHPYKQKEEIKIVRLSDYLNNMDEIDLLKLDIEGGELAVLENLAENNQLLKIKSIALEYHHIPETEDNDLYKIISLLDTSGFNLGFQSKHNSLLQIATGQYYNFMLYAQRPH